MAAAMLIFVHILANAAVEYDIRQSMEREAYKNIKEITMDKSGTFVYQEDFVQEQGDIHFLVLDANGTVLRGKYPDKFPQDIPLQLKKLHQVSLGWETFYIRDMRKHLQNKTNVYMRAVVCKSDAYSRYKTLEYLARSEERRVGKEC